jgi:hypothetical protein
MYYFILTKRIRRVVRVLWRKRINRKEPSDARIVHAVRVVVAVSFAFDLIISLLSLETIPVIGVILLAMSTI